MGLFFSHNSYYFEPQSLNRSQTAMETAPPDQPQVLSSLARPLYAPTATPAPRPRLACLTRATEGNAGSASTAAAELGLTLCGERGPAAILKIDPAGPAYAAGARVGDRVVAVNGHIVMQVSYATYYLDCFICGVSGYEDRVGGLSTVLASSFFYWFGLRADEVLWVIGFA